MSEEFKITFLDSHQLGSIIAINGYKFRSDKDQYYKCCNCSCRAIVDLKRTKKLQKSYLLPTNQISYMIMKTMLKRLRMRDSNLTYLYMQWNIH